MKQSDSNDFLIAALGASAGGLEAFEEFFKHMPADAGIAFVVVQHLAPDHASALPELLARRTRMPVEQARDKTKVVPNRVYIIPPNATLTITKGTLRVVPPAEPRGRRMPIDSLFSSLAEDHGENAVCIMLSGTGTDGTTGLRAIKEYGGMAMAQTLESAKFDAILRSAIDTGLVDHVLPVKEMPAKLLEYGAYLKSANGRRDVREQIAAHIPKIYKLLRSRAGHDFSQYKESTIMRRLQRRMKALQIETVEQYIQVLEGDPKEADRLFKDLLIGVTQFFRDAEAFQVLSREVIPKLFEGKAPDGQVRVCVVGCATGEEAYSMAILLHEHAATLDRAPKLQVFATDIDERGLEWARKGRYAESIAEQVSPERLERFFIKQENAYQVKRDLREICLFTNHSFIKDPPFSRLDLISCRNVIIYLGLDLQKKIVPLFHYALGAGGYLFLGPSESASSHRELFRTVDKKHRIFQKKQTLPRPVISFPLSDVMRPKHDVGKLPEAEEQNLPKQIERIILERYRPACVTVKENGDAVYFSGRTGRYLEPATGAPDANVINMAREGLRIPLRTALHKAATTHERVVQRQVSVQTNGGVSQVDITVEPIAEFGVADLYMILFEDAMPASAGSPAPQARAADSEEIVRHLEGELRSAQEQAQAMLEELESSNEELRSTNEEYQATNEELETSKEEVQSFNEELETVNAELNRRVAELDQANSDLQNLNASTQIATIFLDGHLRIRNFTPAAGSVFRLIPGDAGRPITDLAARFADADFAADIKEVLRTLTVRERDLPGAQGRHYLMRVLPYRTVQDVIDGVVITFTDVTQLKQAQSLAEDATQAAQDAKIYAEGIVDTVREPLLVLDAALCVKSANRSFYEMFDVAEKQTVDRRLYDLGNRQWNIPELRRLLGEILPKKKKLEDFRVDHEFPGIGAKIMLLNAREIPQQRGAARLILLAIEDITERTRAAEKLRSLVEFDEAILTNMGEGLFTVDQAGLLTRMNQAAEELLGWSFEELRGRKMHEMKHHHHPDGTIFPAEECAAFQVLTQGKPLTNHEDVFIRKDGTFFDVVYSAAPLRSENEIAGAVVVFRDVSERKRAEEERRRLDERDQALSVATALRERDAELARIARALTAGELAASIAHEVNQPLAAIVTNADACARWLSAETPNLHEAQESLALIVRDGKRASKVIGRIREFLNKENRQTAPLDINEIVQEAVDLAHPELLKSQVTLRLELAAGLPSVRGDRIALQQVLLNLIMNGRDAMKPIEDGPRKLAVISRKSGNDGVVVAVRDSGVGANPQDIDRMFDAFFTTKPGGIGMGLAISRSIIEAHGGRIWAALNADAGLTVQFSLPAGGGIVENRDEE